MIKLFVILIAVATNLYAEDLARDFNQQRFGIKPSKMNTFSKSYQQTIPSIRKVKFKFSKKKNYRPVKTKRSQYKKRRLVSKDYFKKPTEISDRAKFDHAMAVAREQDQRVRVTQPKRKNSGNGLWVGLILFVGIVAIFFFRQKSLITGKEDV